MNVPTISKDQKKTMSHPRRVILFLSDIFIIYDMEYVVDLFYAEHIVYELNMWIWVERPDKAGYSSLQAK